ncbi:MAG: sugar phosphate isomerase/epimerase [Trichodesmium sp. MAG_R04]|nr:sugar phosphate isomerase/epimerase [Trichodesmium sp. MAG_R04]
MSTSSSLPDIYLSFFMFTTNMFVFPLSMNIAPVESKKLLVAHIRELKAFGYSGFEFPIAPPDGEDFSQDLQNYQELREYLDDQNLSDVKICTNVGATINFDPSSSSPEQREKALEYLKSRVDITEALGGEIMMGPIVIPYGVFPTTNSNEPIWSDRLQEHLAPRYKNAQPVLNKLGEYAEEKNVKLAIEPITHWETPGPNKLSQLIECLEGVPSKQVGVTIDSAHETLDGDGPEIFSQQVKHLAEEQRLHYVQVSPPDRGAVHTSWLPWHDFLRPVLEVYKGPIAVEIFNAIPDFVDSLRLSRRKFWIPGQDDGNSYPSAYTIANEAIQATKKEITKFL